MTDLPLSITSTFTLSEGMLVITAIRAQGPGGQNVNKVSSAVQLRFDFEKVPLPEYIKQKLRASGDKRVLSRGEIVIKAQRFRTLEANKQDAISRLQEILLQAAVKVKNRVPTRPTKSSVRRRLDGKTRRSAVKGARGKISRDQD